MDRPSVLVAVDGETSDYEDALVAAGYHPVSDEAAALARLSSGASFDLAVIDCDRALASDADLFTLLHGERQVPTILLFSAELPDWAVSTSSGSTGDEYARKPVSPTALVYRVEALFMRAGRELPTSMDRDGSSPSASAARRDGKVITVFAPKGGVGRTMIAVNLAVALRDQTGESVCLLDADVGVGNLEAVLEAPYGRGLSDLADSAPEQWTSAVFEQTSVTHKSSGVRVLTWGNDPSDATGIGVDLLVAALRWARGRHDWVIVDTKASYGDRTMAMLAASNEVLLVVTPEVGSLRNAAQFLTLASRTHIAESIRVVLNRSDHGVSHDDVVRTIGVGISATVVSSGAKAITAANEGVPVVTMFPREKISTDLKALARIVSGERRVVTAGSGRARTGIARTGSARAVRSR